MNRLLIVACSQRKNPAKWTLPALERYDGPVFRVLRKYLREGGGDALRVLILSAKYGLITSDKQIPDYNCRLSPASAEKLRPGVLERAGRVLREEPWHSVGVCAGKDYRVALVGLADLMPADVLVDFIEGGQGPRLTALRQWLRCENDSAP